MPDGLYERDFVLWSEAQAGLLRRLAAGERVNEAVDWPNLIEEVEDLGKSQLNAFEGLIVQAFIHLLKCQAWPSSMAHRHWRAETNTLLSAARRHFAPSMRQQIDLQSLYHDALRTVRLDGDDSGPPMVLPEDCPFKLDQLLAEDVGRLWDGGGG